MIAATQEKVISEYFLKILPLPSCPLSSGPGEREWVSSSELLMVPSETLPTQCWKQQKSADTVAGCVATSQWLPVFTSIDIESSLCFKILGSTKSLIQTLFFF